MIFKNIKNKSLITFYIRVQLSYIEAYVIFYFLIKLHIEVELPVDQGMDMSGDWKSRWQAQLGELEKKSASKNSNDNKSWAARVRMQRSKSSI